MLYFPEQNPVLSKNLDTFCHLVAVPSVPGRMKMALKSSGSFNLLYHKHQHLSLRNSAIKYHKLLGNQLSHLNLKCCPGNNKKQLGFWIANCLDNKSSHGHGIGNTAGPDEEVYNFGVTAALTLLGFYKREISPLLPRSCRYVPTCSEYSMIAYKKYGFLKGTVLTAWRLCRCNPLGGSGFDPPRWFDDGSPPE